MPLRAVGFDTETHLIQPGLVAPPLVCASIAEPIEEGRFSRGQLCGKDTARAVFTMLLRDPTLIVCGANFAYDVLVMVADAAGRGEDLMPEVFAMYDPTREIIRGICRGRVFDVQIAESLHAIANGELGIDPRTGGPMVNPETGRRGRYSLRAVVDYVLGRDDAKVNDRFRFRYAELEHLPISEWPHEARTYPVDDAVNTLDVALAQAGHRPSVNRHDWREVLINGRPATQCTHCHQVITLSGPGPDCMRLQPRRNLHDHSRQVYAALAMRLGAAWGFRVDQNAVDVLLEKYNAGRAERTQPFRDAQILRENDTENQSTLKKLVAVAYGSHRTCFPCDGTGKVGSKVTNGRTKVNCSACDGTGLELAPEVPRAEKGGVAKGRDVLYESGDELLMTYAEASEGKKIPDVYVPFLRRGRVCVHCGHHGTDEDPHVPGDSGACGLLYRDIPLTLSPNSLLETGRTSYDGVIQLLPRSGGVRECITARDGYVLSSEDYTAGELVTHAQSCIWLVGYSKLAEALNLGLDAHLALAGTMIGKTYEEMRALRKAKDKLADNSRQAAKPANFGFPGGMGELKLVLQQRRGGPDTPHPSGPAKVWQKGKLVPGYKGLRFCLLMDDAPRCGEQKITSYRDRPCPPTCARCVECARRLREFWFRQWPENNQRDGYFAIIKRLSDQTGPSGTTEVIQHQSRRVRGGVDFCSAANGFFQGLLADAAKNALCAATRECYDRTVRVETGRYAGGGSPLLGSRIIVFQHDEIVAEHPESVAHDAATRISEIMVEALRYACPDLAPACRAEPTLMRRLWKGAEPRYARGGDKPADANDRLIPWEPS